MQMFQPANLTDIRNAILDAYAEKSVKRAELSGRTLSFELARQRAKELYKF